MLALKLLRKFRTRFCFVIWYKWKSFEVEKQRRFDSLRFDDAIFRRNLIEDHSQLRSEESVSKKSIHHLCDEKESPS